MIRYILRLPSFLGGTSSVLDLGANGALYRQFQTRTYSDIRATESDWQNVGGDLRAATEFLMKEAVELRRDMEQFKREQHARGKRKE